MRKSGYLISSLLSLLMPVSVSLAQSYQDIFRGNQSAGDLAADDLVILLENIGGFLIVAGGIIAGIAIITAGLAYMAAGNNSARVQTAKSIFKNGVIGAIILFVSGIIVNTLALLASDPSTFFG